MIKYFTILVILFCAFFRAQDNFIVYDKIIDDTGGFDKIYEKNILAFDNTSSVFFSYKGELDKINDFLNNDEKIRSSQVVRNNFAEKRFLIKDNSFTREILYATDDYQDFNWKLVPNQDIVILGYKCSKAVGSLRGREYTVWFSKDLPADVGPWKFRGLPGAILKATDQDHIFAFEASKIILNFPLKQELAAKFTFVFPENASDYLRYQQYIERENDFLQDVAEKIKANRPIGVTVISNSKERDYKMEKTFEWEAHKKP